MAEVPKAERLVNVVIALLEARKPMSLAELKRRTGYYEGASEASSRRMFERDKDELRRLGVPIETRPVDAFGALDGYIIDRRSYEQPDVHLTPQEAAALALVVQMTGEPADRLAVTRLSARAAAGATAGEAEATDADGDTDPRVVGTRVHLGDEPYAVLAQAVVERQVVRFDYRRGDGTAARRTLAPYAVVNRRGAWYVVGDDRDRQDVRAFRLDRIQGVPELDGPAGAYEVPHGFDPRPHVRGPAAETTDARIAVDPAAAWEAQARGGVATGEEVDGLLVHDFGGADLHRLASWAIGLAERALVLDPPRLREQVVAALRAVREVVA